MSFWTNFSHIWHNHHLCMMFWQSICFHHEIPICTFNLIISPICIFNFKMIFSSIFQIFFNFFLRNILQTHVFKLVKVHSTKQKNTSNSPLIMSFWTKTKFQIFYKITIYRWYFEKHRFFTKKQGFFQYKIPICTFILMIFPICMSNFKTNFPINSSGYFQFFSKNLKITICNYDIKTICFLKNSHLVYVFIKKI